MRSIIFKDLTFGIIDKPTVRPPFPGQLDESRNAGGLVNGSLEVRCFGISKRRIEAVHCCDTNRGTCGGKRCRCVKGFFGTIQRQRFHVGSDIQSLKDTAGLPDLLVITKLLILYTQDRENSAKHCFRYFGIAKDINE